MKKYLMITMILFFCGCQPASKSALEETRRDSSDMAKEILKLAETSKLHAEVLNKYVEMPVEVKTALTQDADNRINETKVIEAKITENSKKEVGIFSKCQFMYFVTQFYDVAKPVLKDMAKAVVDVASNQGGVIGIVGGIIATLYGVYTQVSKNNIVAKVKEEKEIEHETNKLVPAEQHAVWDKAEKEAIVKVISKKKGLA